MLKGIFEFILHLFYLNRQIALTGYMFAIYTSCRAAERNDNMRSATSQRTPSKTIRKTIVSALLDNLKVVVLFDIEG
jgi:hypothetical protein